MSTRISNFSIILILGALSTISPFAIDMYLPAFGQMAHHLNTDVAKIAYSLSSYFVGVAIGQIMYGPLLDRFGRKKPMYFGLTIFILTSLACTRATNIEEFIILRFIQALGGCVSSVAAVAMVRDFFPVKDSAKIFSFIVLIIGVSPLMAPTIGGLVATNLGWKWVFYLLSIITFLIIMVMAIFLPEGRGPDHSVKLRFKPILLSFQSIFKDPQFYTYALAGSFSFAGLLVYVAGSPIIFMDFFHVSPEAYGGIFALSTGGFIGGSQINILLSKKFKSEDIFKNALLFQAFVAVIFLITSYLNVLNLYSVIFLFILYLSALGIMNPNATALALAPFDKNAGSASALIGFLQIGIASIASAGVGFFGSESIFPMIAILSSTSIVGLVILFIGKKHIVHPIHAAENVIALH